ncbi:transcriptional regulator GntR family [Janthinobacterium sp. HH01]|uniref:FadR/GntR family transcriptional regulator n=1 Tax=Janthinobacterium sp. HH01 TaxID=1198452 RepID=UPI0002AE8038|nr:FadR/GntR family transcriptional regulator [Janthinobacterium sp. HH01]ELX13376.1 transcriptional regulator GntR family [Janthinobacterium sp. HH01]
MKTSGLVEGVLRQLETALLDGTYPANARLPSERALAEQYEVSRNTIREALQRLVARGLLRSRRGAGVYVSDQLRTSTASPWGQLVTDHPAVLADVLEFRRVLEGATAYYAALRGSEEEHGQIRSLLNGLEQARLGDDQAVEASIDARLHEAIALASHNSMFLHLHASVLGILREHITLNGSSLRALDAEVSGQLLQQHRAICQAICARRPEAARTAMQAHIDYVVSRIEAG